MVANLVQTGNHLRSKRKEFGEDSATNYCVIRIYEMMV